MGDINLLAALGTIVSIGFLIAQLRQTVNQEVRELIAEYNTRYLAIVARIPYEILVENKSFEELVDDESFDRREITRALYDYFLLCEEQLRLANERTHRDLRGPWRAIRVSGALIVRDVTVWNKAVDEWIAGMRENFKRNAISEVFDKTSNSLRRIEKSELAELNSSYATNENSPAADEPFTLIRQTIG
jgi:hypothetical protein